MAKPLRLAGLLLVTSALTAQAAFAQAPEAPAKAADDTAALPADQPAVQEEQEEQQPEVSIPGGQIVVVGRREANIEKTSASVVSVLSAQDIARTGEGNIAGSLSHVTGLSVVGNGFVYVRGLGDRYSLALLNGSPLPSPEPLKRVVPLDVFPTNIIASSLVQKSFSANFPGEFGGGVINLTTLTIPRKTFLDVSGGLGINSETTGQLGYTYYGSGTDWTGFDNGSRNLTAPLVDWISSGKSVEEVDDNAISRTLVTGANSLIQKVDHMAPNTSASITGGTSFMVGDAELGIIATAGYNNKWRTRDTIQQSPQASDLSTTNQDFRAVITDNRIVVNGLFGLGLEFGDNKVRWINLFIRDTLKYASLGAGVKNTNQPGQDFIDEKTAWYERQMLTTQFVGEFKFGDFSVDLRGSYANSQREAPYEFNYEWDKSNSGIYGAYYLNDLNGQFAARPTMAFSDLNEDLWAGGIDLSYPIADTVTATVGYAYSNTQRDQSRYELAFKQGNVPDDNPDIYKQLGLMRQDFLLALPSVVGQDGREIFGVHLNDQSPNNHAFEAKLRVQALYGQIKAELVPGLTLDAGVRYEKGKQSTVRADAGIVATPTTLDRDYFLPTATLTYAWNNNMQVRFNASKTIARPQFRELVYQPFYDPESNRTLVGNRFLTDSQLYNFEGRWEWYFARDEHVSAAVFYKRIDHPIESYANYSENGVTQLFANAPTANLYGAEVELEKRFDLSSMADSGFFSTRRFVVNANYTYSKSKLKIGANDTALTEGGGDAVRVVPALNLFTDGTPLIGQSDHVTNLEFSLEDADSLSQQTIILSYASKRVTQRGSSQYPDYYETPGFQLDFVARQGIKIAGIDAELKAEVRNITGHVYKEFQQSGSNIVYANKYKQGTMFNATLKVNF